MRRPLYARGVVVALAVYASVAIGAAGCSYLARPVGAPSASLSEPQRLLATYGGAIESSRRLLTVTTEGVGLALRARLADLQRRAEGGEITTEQATASKDAAVAAVRTYRDAAVAADAALTVAAVALQAAVEAPDATREQRAIDALSAAMAALGRARALAPSGAGGGA